VRNELQMARYEEIDIDQGADVAIELHLINDDGSVKNLSGHDCAAKLKRSYNSDSSDTTDFTVSLQDSDGIATLALTNAQTDLLKSGRYVYDVELSYVDSGGSTIIERILEGTITVSPSVTK